MRVLVTGANGFIGQHLCYHLKQQEGLTVFALDITKPSSPLFYSADFYNQQDILDYKGLEFVFDHIRPHIVFHLAAKLGVEDVMAQPGKTVSENVLGTLHISDLCKHFGTHLVFASTSDVYGQSTDLPFREDRMLAIGPSVEPRWSYAISKLAGEHLTLGVGGTVLRFFNVTGPGQTTKYVLPIMVEKALKGEDITVYGDGGATRCFADVRDVVQAVGAFVDKMDETQGQIYNIGWDEEIGMFELAFEVKYVLGSLSDIKTVPYPNNYTEMPRRVPDLTKIKNLLTEVDEDSTVVREWGCEIGLEQTIRDVAKWIKERGVSH